MYRKALEYFLESNSYFYSNIFNIVDYNLIGICSDGKKEYNYVTEVAIKFLKLFKVKKESDNYYLILRKANVENYFIRNYSDIQLTCIIFSIIFNRSEDEINFISNKRYEAYSCLILYNLLCGKTLCEIKDIFTKIKPFHKRMAELSKTLYPGVYYICEKNCPMQEIKDGIQAHHSAKASGETGNLNYLTDNNGNEYKMIF